MGSAARWLRRATRRAAFVALAGLAPLLGFRRAPAFGKLVGELEYRVGTLRRRRCEHDMAIALGHPLGDRSVAGQLRRAHHLNAQAVLEILAMLARREQDAVLATRLALEGTEHLRAALAEGRGAILLGTHAGNGVLLAVCLAAEGWPMSVVYRQARMMPAEFWEQGFARYGVEGILANEGLRAYARMRDAVRRGRIVFITLDQGVKHAHSGVPVRFLGKDMGMAAGPAQLARHTGAPLLPVFAAGYDGLWRFRIEPPLPPATGPLAADVQRLARIAERQVRLHPELWSWHHRRWRKQPFPHATIASWKEDHDPCSTSMKRP